MQIVLLKKTALTQDGIKPKIKLLRCLSGTLAAYRHIKAFTDVFIILCIFDSIVKHIFLLFSHIILLPLFLKYVNSKIHGNYCSIYIVSFIIVVF